MSHGEIIETQYKTFTQVPRYRDGVHDTGLKITETGLQDKVSGLLPQ